MQKKKILRILSVLFALSALAGYVACSQRLHNPAPVPAATSAIAPRPAPTQSPSGGRAPMPAFPASNVTVISAAEKDQIMASGSKSAVLAPDVEKLIQQTSSNPVSVTKAPPAPPAKP